MRNTIGCWVVGLGVMITSTRTFREKFTYYRSPRLLVKLGLYTITSAISGTGK
jgi:hypothetical protein